MRFRHMAFEKVYNQFENIFQPQRILLLNRDIYLSVYFMRFVYGDRCVVGWLFGFSKWAGEWIVSLSRSSWSWPAILWFLFCVFAHQQQNIWTSKTLFEESNCTQIINEMKCKWGKFEWWFDYLLALYCLVIFFFYLLSKHFIIMTFVLAFVCVCVVCIISYYARCQMNHRMMVFTQK